MKNTDNGDLFGLERDKVIHTTGLAELELCQLNSSGADGNSTRAQICLRTDPLSRTDGLGQQTVQNRANGTVFLT